MDELVAFEPSGMAVPGGGLGTGMLTRDFCDGEEQAHDDVGFCAARSHMDDFEGAEWLKTGVDEPFRPPDPLLPKPPADVTSEIRLRGPPILTLRRLQEPRDDEFGRAGDGPHPDCSDYAQDNQGDGNVSHRRAFRVTYASGCCSPSVRDTGR